ncbi:helix-turn-helix domain-containing protein [Alkalibacillus almallahensis]|uniref:helix-turn-helix domain-containing protein n=1 Tax=Alkalibacillus almallahensis TaxID=1379154 RepID=UPI00141E8D8F|nr:helix-turn-helix domain-containing protein [Alkalibacillus almallahensis]NIK11502.1 DNA-binding transcriptional ArsR family regulator [Alkalibacillus almallahensis]
MKDKADLMLHPVRMRILQELFLKKDTPMTIGDILYALGDVSQATLYRHMNLLLEGDFIKVVDTRKVKGTQERLFGLNQDYLQINETDIENISQENHVLHFSSFQSFLFEQATSYLQNQTPDNYQEDGFSYWITPLNLSDKEFEELNRSMYELIKQYADNELTQDRTTRVFGGAFIPKK